MKSEPDRPLRWDYTTHLGEPVKMVRLIRVDLGRAYQQAPANPSHIAKDTGYQTTRDYMAMREYLKKRFGLHYVQYVQEPSYHECWISIPTTDSPNYRTSLTKWNTILRRWPAFIDPFAVLKGKKS